MITFQVKKESLDKKELRRSDFLIPIEEYVGAKGNTLVDHKKRKKYKNGIKVIKT